MKKLIIALFLLTIFNYTIADEIQKSNLTVGIVKTKIVEGKTSQNDIIELIGSPNIITTNSEGKEVWTYSKSSYEVKGKSVDRTSFWSFLIGAYTTSSSEVVGRTSTSSIDLIITFNSKGIVEKYRVISSSF